MVYKHCKIRLLYVLNNIYILLTKFNQLTLLVWIYMDIVWNNILTVTFF